MYRWPTIVFVLSFAIFVISSPSQADDKLVRVHFWQGDWSGSY
jgi:hypothetical protein